MRGSANTLSSGLNVLTSTYAAYEDSRNISASKRTNEFIGAAPLSFGSCHSSEDQISGQEQYPQESQVQAIWSYGESNTSSSSSFSVKVSKSSSTLSLGASFQDEEVKVKSQPMFSLTAKVQQKQAAVLNLKFSHQKYKYKSKTKKCSKNGPFLLGQLLPTKIVAVLRQIKPPTTITKVETDTVAAKKAKLTKSAGSSHCSRSVGKFRLLPTLGATSFFTLLTLICLETVLLSTMSTCAKTFYMHWNTSNSIFRIDNTDHIIDVNKGNLAFEFDQVHIICPVYEPGTFENETEKYIIYNVSKVEYETCRITNADPRVIAICDKPQKLMFFTITFRPFTPQPGGLEFLPGNDYYFISTSSKDDLYRRIGGRCSTNNMKVVFKVCCAAEEKNKTTQDTTPKGVSGGTGASGVGSESFPDTGMHPGGNDNTAVNMDMNTPINVNQGGGGVGHHMNNINTIGVNGVNTGLIPNVNGGAGGIQLKPINGVGTINTNIDQFNRIPIQPNIVGGAGVGSLGMGSHGGGSGSIMLPSGHGGINMLPPTRGGVNIAQYPGHHHVQSGIRINNVPTQQQSYPPSYKNGNANGKDNVDDDYLQSVSAAGGGGSTTGKSVLPINFLPPIVDTNHSNIVQSTINWPPWVSNSSTTNITDINQNHLLLFNNYTNINKTNTYVSHDISNINTPSHRPTTFGINNRKNDHHYDKHPNEVVKNEELTYNSGAASLKIKSLSWTTALTSTSHVADIYDWLKSRTNYFGCFDVLLLAVLVLNSLHCIGYNSMSLLSVTRSNPTNIRTRDRRRRNSIRR